MKYQIIFIKFQNFLNKIDKLVQASLMSRKNLLFHNLKQKTLLQKFYPSKNNIGSKKANYLFKKLSAVFHHLQIKRYFKFLLTQIYTIKIIKLFNNSN
jgi:hypothetical protein